MKGEEKTSFSGTQAFLPRVGIHVLLCLASKKEFLNHWVRNNINIIIIQLSVSIWNMLWSLAVILWRRLFPRLTPLMAFNKHWRFIHQSLSAFMPGGCPVLQFSLSSLFFYDYISFINMVFFVRVTKQPVLKEFNLDNGNNLVKTLTCTGYFKVPTQSSSGSLLLAWELTHFETRASELLWSIVL